MVWPLSRMIILEAQGQADSEEQDMETEHGGLPVSPCGQAGVTPLLGHCAVSQSTPEHPRGALPAHPLPVTVRPGQHPKHTPWLPAPSVTLSTERPRGPSSPASLTSGKMTVAE